jgi:hypothetical protein
MCLARHVIITYLKKGGPPIEAEDLTRENKHRGEADELRNIEFVLVTYLTKS